MTHERIGKALEGGVRDANGVYTATMEYMYDDVAQTVAVVEKASGKYTKYRYDAEDNRIGRALEGGVRDASGVYTVTTDYVYDEVAQTVAMVDRATGAYTKYGYDMTHERIGKALEGGVRDANGVYTATTEYMYDDVAQTVAVVEKASGKYTKYRYDAEDNRIGRALEGGKRDVSGNYTVTIEYDYSVAGSVAVVDLETDEYTRYRYDEDNEQIQMALEGGVRDADGDYNKETVYDYESVAGTVAIVDLETGNYTRYSFDGAQNRIGMAIEGGIKENDVYTVKTEYDYDDVTGTVAVVDVLSGEYTRYAYSVEDNRIGKVVEGGIRDANGVYQVTMTYVYDELAGTVAMVEIATGAYTKYHYDRTNEQIGRAIEGGIRDANGAYKAATEYIYNEAAGTVAIVEKATGEYTKYNFNGQTNRIGRAIEGGVRDANGIYGATTEYVYDEIAGTVAVVQIMSHEYTLYSFDRESGQMGRAIEGGVRNANGEYVKKYEYDYSIQDIVIVRDLENKTYRKYEFDAVQNRVGRILEAGYYDNEGIPVIQKIFEYLDEEVKKVVDTVNHTTSYYNARDELIRFIDEAGVTTFLENGLIQRIEDKNGNVLRDYQYVIDPQTQQYTGADFTNKEISRQVSQVVDERLRRNIYETGVIENFITEKDGDHDFLVTDLLGIGQMTNDEDGNTTVYLNSGTVMRYRDAPSGGQQEVLDEVINLKGKITKTIYNISDLDGLVSKISAYITLTDYVDDNKYLDGTDDADIAIIQDNTDAIIGAIIYTQETGLTKIVGGNPQIDFAIEWDGTKRQYRYNKDEKEDLDEIEEWAFPEPGQDPRLISRVVYKDESDDIDYVLGYNGDGSKALIRSDYEYDPDLEKRIPGPNWVNQYDVSNLAMPETKGTGLFQSRTDYMESPWHSGEVLINFITDKQDNVSQYHYLNENIERVDQKDANHILLSETFYEMGHYFNDRIKSVVTYKDDPESDVPTQVLPKEQTFYDYDELDKVRTLTKYEIVGTADSDPLHIADDKLISETFFEADVPLLEMTYKWVDVDSDPGTPDEKFIKKYTVMTYGADKKTTVYSDEYAITGNFVTTYQSIKQRLNGDDPAMDTFAEVLAVLVAEQGKNQSQKSRVYYNDLGTRPVYSVSMDDQGKSSSLSEFNYDDTGDGDLRWIDQWDIAGDANYFPLPADGSSVIKPSDPKKFESTVYFDEAGIRSEFSVSYSYEDGAQGTVQKISQYSIFYYGDDRNMIAYTDSYKLTGDSDIRWSAIQLKLDPDNSSMNTIRKVITQILNDDVSNDLMSSRTFLDEDGRPLLSIEVNQDGQVSGVSTYTVDLETEKILWVDSLKLNDSDNATPGFQNFDFNASTMNTADDVSVTQLYASNQCTSRTYLNSDGDPVLSVSIDENDKVSGISEFHLTNGKIDWVDS
ncbi:MAG: hypothetical protein PHS88_05480, partial [Candidatus Omnitrophica bacterium]|nr:hypothetical protein [Candidatus Omnitrophota bacterium]